MNATQRMRVFASVGAAITIGTSICSVAFAAPVAISGTFHFLDNRSNNSVGISTGVRQTLGAVSVTPSAGTTGIATQGTASAPLFFQPFTVAPNFYSVSLPAIDAPNGSWTLQFTNGGDITTASTPDIFGASVMAHPTSVAVSGSGSSPTFNWSNPTASNIDAVRINIWDVNRQVGNTNISDVIYSNTFGSGITAFSVASANLDLLFGKTYSLEISLLDLRSSSDDFGNGNILSRSRSFFDFQLLTDAPDANVYLPTVSFSNTQPIFNFDVAVTGGQQIFIDPEIAIGYDYHIGANDPFIRSVLLPTDVGDGIYDVYLWNGSDWVLFAVGVSGGTDFDFGPNGVDRFRVQGIETSAGLNPTDPTAFITGLTFVADGQFTGTMIPLIVAIPEPGTILLLAIGIASILLCRQSSDGPRHWKLRAG